MKKKRVLIVAMLACILCLHAKDIVVHIKGTLQTGNGHTEVTNIPSVFVDTLTVVPGVNTDTITVRLCDMRGEVLESHSVPATFNDHVFVMSPTLPDGCYIEVRDDKGVIYTQQQ